MAKRTTLIIAAVLAAAVLVVTLLLVNRLRPNPNPEPNVPAFTFPDNISHSSAPESSAPSDSSTAPNSSNSPDNSSDVPPDSSDVPPEEGPRTYIANANPCHTISFTLDGSSIAINGKYELTSVEGAYLSAPDGTEINAEAAQTGHEFALTVSAEGRPKGYYILYIKQNVGFNERYGFILGEDGFYLPDDGVSDANAALIGMAFELAADDLSEYVDANKDSEVIAETLCEIQLLSDTICEGLSNDYDKLLAIDRWVADNIYYDGDASHTNVSPETISLAHILATHRTVCSGFANITSALCCAQGIPCVNVHGSAVNYGGSFFDPRNGETGYHEWNIAFVGGREVWIDTTWDTHNHYENGVYGAGISYIAWFDLSPEFYAANHKISYCVRRDYSRLI